MAKIDPSLRLTAGEIDAIMSDESRLRIATHGPADEINLTPMTFGWAEGKVYIFGRGQKIANLRRNASATILVDTGSAWRELQGIMMPGTAKVLESASEEENDDSLPLARLNLGAKHNLTKDGVIAPYSASASGRSRRWIVFTPARVISWNNAKLP